MRSRILIAALLLSTATTALAADRQWGIAVARGTESDETDIVRLTYRHPLKENGSWWMPSHVQLGVGVWRVPDIRGTTRRLDGSVSAIWRGEKPWGYLEAASAATCCRRPSTTTRTDCPRRSSSVRTSAPA